MTSHSLSADVAIIAEGDSQSDWEAGMVRRGLLCHAAGGLCRVCLRLCMANKQLSDLAIFGSLVTISL
jgi:hypothetical protein